MCLSRRNGGHHGPLWRWQDHLYERALWEGAVCQSFPVRQTWVVMDFPGESHGEWQGFAVPLAKLWFGKVIHGFE